MILLEHRMQPLGSMDGGGSFVFGSESGFALFVPFLSERGSGFIARASPEFPRNLYCSFIFAHIFVPASKTAGFSNTWSAIRLDLRFALSIQTK